MSARLLSEIGALSTAFVLAVVVIVLLVATAKSEERSTFTDRNGHYSGSSITRGPKTDFFDARGSYRGTATQQGTQSNPLGKVDGSDPLGLKQRRK